MRCVPAGSSPVGSAATSNDHRKSESRPHCSYVFTPLGNSNPLLHLQRNVMISISSFGVNFSHFDTFSSRATLADILLYLSVLSVGLKGHSCTSPHAYNDTFYLLNFICKLQDLSNDLTYKQGIIIRI